MEILVVGGGGGAARGGAGGAGGIIYADAAPVVVATMPIHVGGGGGGTNGPPYAAPGVNSVFTHPLGTMTGYGGGEGTGDSAGQPGGSGVVLAPILVHLGEMVYNLHIHLYHLLQNFSDLMVVRVSVMVHMLPVAAVVVQAV